MIPASAHAQDAPIDSTQTLSYDKDESSRIRSMSPYRTIARKAVRYFLPIGFLQISARVFMDGEPDQFQGRIDATYGQHISELVPQKTQDDLIVSITPSRTIVSSAGLRLFLEVTGETQFTKGNVDSAVTNFLDPLFVYQSLFLGRRFSAASEDGSMSFDLTAGLGYALQQTVANNFVLQQNRNIVVSANNPLNQSDVTIESGYSAILDVNYSKCVATDLRFTLDAKTVALTKDDVHFNFSNARVTSLFSLGIQYKIINLTYNGHLIYDPNLSLERELSQFLGFGIKFDLD